MPISKKKLLEKYSSSTAVGPFKGKIVIGFCYYIAGPIALQQLVEQGMLVIKIEHKPTGDPTRGFFSQEIFNNFTRGQLSVAIDYKNSEDLLLLQQLLRIADVIVDNRSVRAKENDTQLTGFLASDKKAPVIHCSLDGFPDASHNRMPGLDASIQAYTGFAHTNCSAPNMPLKIGAPVLDFTTGLLAAHYICTNLFALTQSPCLSPETKQVLQITVSLAGTSVWLQAMQFLDTMSGDEYLRSGNKDRYAAPFSYYTTKNGLISIATVNEVQFETFCLNVLKNPMLHTRYPTIQQRIENQDDFEQALNTLLKANDTEYWLTECEKWGVPVAPVLRVSEALKMPFIQSMVGSTADGKPTITHGTKQSLFPTQALPPAPQLGQNTEDIRSLMQLNSKL